MSTHDEYGMCHNCGEWFDEMDMMKHKNHYYCMECIPKGTCYKCKGQFPLPTMERETKGNLQNVLACEECSSIMTYCHNCQNPIYMGEPYQHPSPYGFYYCAECPVEE